MNDKRIQSLGMQVGYEDPLTLFLFELHGVFMERSEEGTRLRRRRVVRIAIYQGAPTVPLWVVLGVNSFFYWKKIAR